MTKFQCSNIFGEYLKIQQIWAVENGWPNVNVQNGESQIESESNSTSKTRMSKSKSQHRHPGNDEKETTNIFQK